MDAARLTELISEYKLRTRTEKEFQDDIEEILLSKDLDFGRESRLTTVDIVDFLVGSVGLECKTKGSKADVMRQLSRYAQSERVSELLLVTTRSSHRPLNGISLQGKSVSVCWINNL